MGKNPAQKAKAAATQAKENKKDGIVRKAKAKKPPKKTVEVKSDGEKHCRIASCKRDYRAKGYCDSHYKQWRQGAFGKKRFKACGDIGCVKPMALNRHGYCEDHFQSYYVKGVEVAKVPAPAPAAEAKTEAKPEKTAASA